MCNNLQSKQINAFLKDAFDSDSSSSSSTESDESELFSSSSSLSSSESYKPLNRKLRRITMFMDTVKEYDNDEFKTHFHLHRSTVDFIIRMVKTENILTEFKFVREKLNAEKAVLMTVWYLSNTETFRQCSDRFNVSKSSTHRVINKIITFLAKKSRQYIVWPTGSELQKVKNAFYKVSGFNGVVGAIDGSHVKIKRPMSKHHYVYYNRRPDCNILIQGVCEPSKKFISFFCGEPGYMYDSCMLINSAFYRKAANGFLGDNYLLGDSAYPCLEWLVPPFQDNGHLTENQRLFNSRHSSTRIVIENVFGLLKRRFRRLNFFENVDVSFVVSCLVASAVLHNICLDNPEENYIDLNEDENQNVEDISSILNGGCCRRSQIFQEMFGD